MHLSSDVSFELSPYSKSTHQICWNCFPCRKLRRLLAIGAEPDALPQNVGVISTYTPSDNDNLKKTLDGHIRIESEANEDGVSQIVDIEPNQQAKIVVGYLEKSNVNAIEEMVNTIDQQRKFEMHVKFIQMAEELDSVGANLMRLPGM